MILSTSPGHLDPPFDAFENPLAVTSSESYSAAVYPIVAVCLLAWRWPQSISCVRFRRSRGEERQQFKWFAGSAGLLLAHVADPVIFNEFSGVAGAIFLVASSLYRSPSASPSSATGSTRST